MRRCVFALLLAVPLGGCLSFSSSNPPPPSHTTVVVPPAPPTCPPGQTTC